MKTITRKDYWIWFLGVTIAYTLGLVMAENNAGAISAITMIAALIAWVVIVFQRIRVIGLWYALLIFIPFGFLIIGCIPDPKGEAS